ncbi:hypothetical protein BCEP4_670020 [Burkholderia cepacia]|nr:hypothetical protein BCEP4_670020 [Burkholderia cepacia]
MTAVSAHNPGCRRHRPLAGTDRHFAAAIPTHRRRPGTSRHTRSPDIGAPRRQNVAAAARCVPGQQ